MIKTENGLAEIRGQKSLILAELTDLIRKLTQEFGIEIMMKYCLLAIHSSEVPDDELEQFLEETEIEFEYHGINENKAGGTA